MFWALSLCVQTQDPHAATRHCPSLEALGECAAAVPIVGGLALALAGGCQGITEAKVNQGAIQSMGLRIHEVALTLAELLPAAVAAGAVTGATTVHLKRLEGLVVECGEFVAEYGSRGFLSRIFRSSWDAIRVEKLDRDLSGSVQDLAMLLGEAQMRLQTKTFDEVRNLTKALDGTRDDVAT